MSRSTEAVAAAGVQVAEPAPPAAVASTLGQTPHEPAVRPWELELLISGALVFSMIQLPGQIDAWFLGLSPRLDGGAHLAAFMAWFYVKMALYALVGGFVLHLAVRGYWVGVIGIEAVFPNGILWERTRSGPIVREMQRQRTPSLQTVIDRADRFASMVFGGAFAIALLFGYSLVMGGLLVLVTFIISRLLLHGTADAAVAMQIAAVMLVAPIAIVSLIDRRMGDRLDPQGRTARTVRGVAGAYSRMQNAALFLPLLLTLLTNLRQRRHGITMVLVMMTFVSFFMVKDVLLARGVIRADGYTYLPGKPGSLDLRPAYYADRRGDDPDAAGMPQIQSDMVRDPYVRLFIPYRPRRHNELLARGCPQAARGRAGSDSAGAAVLRCMAALQPVTLNGRPLTPSYRFSTLPGTGIRGIVTYIPTAGLPRGENVLTVGALADPEDTPAEAARPRPPHTIPFWL